ncbi:hypothetical protein BDV59DRAFT_196938 [Aspergillus ambiguus]|uniref:uncharacterized protein n=1 Tax=Aspergillus ambiguus TaxID=176160 RepID=UPI003CCCA78A
MSTNSGLRGTCDVCLHQNNEYSTAPCPVTGGCFRSSTNFTYRICYACKAHPRGRDNLVFGGFRQRDVSRAQKDNYRNTGNSRGDTSSREIGSSSLLVSSSP